MSGSGAKNDLIHSSLRAISESNAICMQQGYKIAHILCVMTNEMCACALKSAES